MRTRQIPGTNEHLPVVGVGAPSIFIEMPPEGKIRYIGVSRTRETDFSDLEIFMQDEKPDFLMIGYSITQQGQTHC